MKITDLRREEIPGGARIRARAEWEDSDRPARDLYIEVAGPAAVHLRPSPDAFLLAGIVPAFHHGERRLLVEGPVCPLLRDGVPASLGLLRSWFGPDRPMIAIEATGGFRASPFAGPRGLGTFFSGGVDSLFALRKSMTEIPAGHPFAVTAALQVVGHDSADPERGYWSPSHTEEVRRSAASAAAAARVEFIPVRCNLRMLEPADEFYIRQSCGALLAAAATALAGRFENVLHPSTVAADQLAAFGNHPLLDVGYSSSAIGILHHGLGISRQEKIWLLAQWPEGRRHLRVCNTWPIPEGYLNCGVCEKCLRTRVGLLVLGRLDDVPTFPPGEISPEQIERTTARRDFETYWSELVEPLRAIGRDDLARAVESRTRLHRREMAWFGEAGWRGALRRLDRRYLGGRLLALRRGLGRRAGGA
jgi:hypothetical protein